MLHDIFQKSRPNSAYQPTESEAAVFDSAAATEPLSGACGSGNPESCENRGFWFRYQSGRRGSCRCCPPSPATPDPVEPFWRFRSLLAYSLANYSGV